MDKKSGKVIYRRVHGRIIPIRVKEQTAGYKMLGAGLATTAGGLVIAGQGLKRAVASGNKAIKATTAAALAFEPAHHTVLGQRVSEMAIKNAVRNLKALKVATTLSRIAMFGSAAIGSVLIAKGTKKILQNTSQPKKPAVNEAISSVTGFAAGTGAVLAFTAGYDKQLFGQFVKKALFRK